MTLKSRGVFVGRSSAPTDYEEDDGCLGGEEEGGSSILETMTMMANNDDDGDDNVIRSRPSITPQRDTWRRSQ